MNWFRLYAEARNDAKLRALSDAQHRCWFNLLCYASEQPERGVIADYDSDVLALEVANGDGDLLAETLARLTKLRIVTVDDSGISFINWLKRQYDKPSDQPAAIRARVEKHRAATGVTSTPVTPPVVPSQPSNAVQRDVTPCNAYTQNREYTEQIRTEQSVTPARDPFDDLPPAPGSIYAPRELHPTPKPEPAPTDQAVFDALVAAYPPNGTDGFPHNLDTARDALLVVPRADRPKLAAAAARYRSSKKVGEGFVYNLDNWLADGHWKRYTADPTPLPSATDSAPRRVVTRRAQEAPVA